MMTTGPCSTLWPRHGMPSATAKAMSSATKVLPLPEAPKSTHRSALGRTPLISHLHSGCRASSYIGMVAKRPRSCRSSAVMASTLAMTASGVATARVWV